MAKLLIGTPIRKPRQVRDMEEPGQPMDYQPNEEVDTGALGLTPIEVAQYIRDGVLVEPVKVTPPAKTKPAAQEQPARGKPAGGK